MQSTILKTIDLRSRIWSVKYFARLVWQVLFDEYRTNGGDLNHMDSLLCDLYSIESWFIDNPNGFSCDWEFYRSVTNIYPFCGAECIRIKYEPENKQIILTKENQP